MLQSVVGKTDVYQRCFCDVLSRFSQCEDYVHGLSKAHFGSILYFLVFLLRCM